MKNLRMYLAMRIPSPSHSKFMRKKQQPKRIRLATDRKNRKALRASKRGET